MPNKKHVHFDIPRTPSPSYSNSSAPSSPALRTPPTWPTTLPNDAHLNVSPGRARGHVRTPSPLSLYSPVAIHALLCSSSYARQTVPFVWNVSLHPDSIRAPNPLDPRSPLQYALSPETLYQPATQPPTSKLVLRSELYPWKIEVVPLDNSNPHAPVTVRDLLYTLYRNLRLPVSKTEFEQACREQPQLERGAYDAYHARCAKISDPRARAEEERKGLKRVDFLMRRLSFAGLSPGIKPGELFLLLR